MPMVWFQCKKWQVSPGQLGQWVGTSSHTPKCCVFDPGQGIYLGCRFGPPVRAWMEATIDVSLSPSFSVSLSHSLPPSHPSCLSKINNCIHRWGLKMALASEIFCSRRWWTRGVVSSEWSSPFSPGGMLEINKFWLGLCFSFKIFIYLFSRDGGREGERERNISASHAPPIGDLAHNPGVCPDWEPNWRLFDLQAGAQSTEPHQSRHNF